MRNRILAVSAAAFAASMGLAAPADAAQDDAQLSVLHGVPDLTVDVWVNGERTLDDFTPGSLAGPLALPAGSYSVAITAADAASADDAVLGPVDLKLAAKGNYTAVAHLDAGGKPTASLFTNDMSAIPAGKGKLTVRHTAAAPAVDVLAGGTAVIKDLANPEEKTLTLDPGAVPASVAAAGTTKAVIGPADIPVAEGSNTIVYAWGSLKGGNLDVAVQTLEGLQSNPKAVPGGRSGAAAADNSALVAGGAGAALLLAAAGGLALRRRAAAARNR
ncbi:DUF4397 domain-containing protein [Arthrobacter sp. GCM10027362]|uniref:DUF4397 domain-containing protein n=1 Tax=Arthrobacter sp. GCM10027362 TaxID=3273379 RepID=UPI00363AC675